MASGSYYISVPIQSQTCINQPWWIPSDTDSSEVYTQWYESAYKAALQAAQEKDCSGKIKLKYFKRKLEPVDPKVDAGTKNVLIVIISILKTFFYREGGKCSKRAFSFDEAP